MKPRPSKQRYAVCVRNTGYRTSLIVRKIYEVVPDPEATERGLLRVVDESGEDYLFPKQLFVAVDLPEEVDRAIAGAT